MLIAATLLLAALQTGFTEQQNNLITAIIAVESGGKDDAIGDNGNAIGCLQIWKVCWIDAVEYDKTIGGVYEDCKKRDYAIKVFDAYMRRYAKGAWTSGNIDAEKCSRIWNGGPKGYTKESTKPYWTKVSKQLKK